MAIRRGNRGEQVKDLQTQLKSAGFDPGNIDGIFGPKTEAAVRKFQEKNAPPIDGIVGPITTKALDDLKNKQSVDSPNKEGVSVDDGVFFTKEYTLEEIQQKLDNAYATAPSMIKARAAKVRSIIDSSLYKMKEMYITEDTAVLSAKKPAEPTVVEQATSATSTPSGEQQTTESTKFSLDTAPNLRKGSSGESVKELQRLLIKFGYTDVGNVDGIFGPKTERAVKQFQVQQKLAVDGIVGPATKKSLKELSN